MALVLDGNGTMTVGNGDITGITAGALPSTFIGTGAVLQVVQNTYSSGTSTSGTSYVTTNLTASITPTSSSSRILVIASLNGGITGSQGINSSGMFTVYRNSTKVGGDAVLRNYSYAGGGGAGIYMDIPISLSCLDSPSTTSSTTYSIYLATLASTTTYINPDGGTSFITLLEIA